MEDRALLDSASSSSFISERIVQSLRLKRSKQRITVSGIGGLSPDHPVQSITSFRIASMTSNERTIDVTALVVPKVTCDLPTFPVPYDPTWTHLSDLHLADPEFGVPGRIDILLGVDVFTGVLLNGRRKGPPRSPIALETCFGWVLCGNTHSTPLSSSTVTSCHALVEVGDDLLRRFWEIEEAPNHDSHLSMEEHTVMQHFKVNHTRRTNGRFVVPLPKKIDGKFLGESRSQAVRRFLSLEHSLNDKK